MCAHEYGNTRERQLKWLNDDSEWNDNFDYPKEINHDKIDGVMPFMQVRRETKISRDELV